MNFDTMPGVVRATVVIEIADGTTWTYDLVAASGARIDADKALIAATGMTWPYPDLDLQLGPDLPELPRPFPPPQRQIVFAFALGRAARQKRTVTVTRTQNPPGG